MLGKRVRKLEPSELALFDEYLAEQCAAFALHLEGCLSIVRRDESEVDEDLPDWTADAESERGDGWSDHSRLDLGLLGHVCVAVQLREQSRDIRLGNSELGNHDLVER